METAFQLITAHCSRGAKASLLKLSMAFKATPGAPLRATTLLRKFSLFGTGVEVAAELRCCVAIIASCKFDSEQPDSAAEIRYNPACARAARFPPKPARAMQQTTPARCTLTGCACRRAAMKFPASAATTSHQSTKPKIGTSDERLETRRVTSARTALAARLLTAMCAR